MRSRALKGARLGLLLVFASVLCLAPFLTGMNTGGPLSVLEEPTEVGSFRLPASLRVVGDEAFEGTAVETAILPDGAAEIGDRAFANADGLREVYIPGSVAQIGADAFSGGGGLTVFGLAGSAADDWAAEHGIPFEVRDIWSGAGLPRLPVEWALGLLLLALAFLGVRETDLFSVRKTAFAVEYMAMGERKRAELFVRDLCFP